LTDLSGRHACARGLTGNYTGQRPVSSGMDGLGVPLATPFDADGDVDHDRLADLANWVLDRGADFLVPCGSTSEAPLLAPDERTAVIETVAGATDAPVLAGTGFAGYRQTVRATDAAADAGADAALVVTPYYYGHDADALAAYYRDVADAADVPVYLYSVPKFTDVALAPRTVESLAAHGNVVGMKDSSGDLAAFQRTRRLAPDLDLFVGSGGVVGHGVAAGGDGAILAVANVAPELASEVVELAASGETGAALDANADLVELNRAVTGTYGVPGLKAAMRERGAPVGTVRRPFRPVGDEAATELAELLAELDY
jgi:dihydrodipicolinate synthase/N-acetylneuraminate lyase